MYRKGTIVTKREIGGYFPLFTQKQENTFFETGIGLNCGRAGLRYLIRQEKITKLWVPAFTCPVVWETVEQEGCQVLFYEISEDFRPKEAIPSEDYLLYTNYFGLCETQVKELEATHPYLLVDNTQSLFSPKMGLGSFNSLRKFIGVAEGGYLYYEDKTPLSLARDIAATRYVPLLQRVEESAQAGYGLYVENERYFEECHLKRMSQLTEYIAHSQNFQEIAEKRRENFLELHSYLQEKNTLEAFVLGEQVPMCYPLLLPVDGLREKLIGDHIYIPTYWKHQKDRHTGNLMERYLLPLPIDQRYDKETMSYLLERINYFIST